MLYPRIGEQIGDGVRDHGEQLVTALNHAGYQAHHGTWATSAAEFVVVQYTPFAWGRRGLAPTLAVRIVALRRRRPRPRIVLMVHETFLVDGRLRDRLLGLAQRQQLHLLCMLADIVLVSIEPWQRLLGRWRGVRPVGHLPVGSNLPDMRPTREATRRELGLDENDIVLAAFDSPHPGRSQTLIQIGVRAAAEAGASMLLLLGAEARTSNMHMVPTLVPGAVSAERLASHLAAADIFLAPFVDGVSTRRTTMIAGLQHGLPVVGTIGHLTDPELYGPGHGLVLVPIGEPAAFGEAVAALVHDPGLRAATGREARIFYERRFSWPAIVELLTTMLRTLDRD